MADARAGLRHDRGVAEVAKAGADLQTQLGQAQTQLGLRESLTQPTRLEYGAGFGEAFPKMPRAEREQPVLNPLMPSMPGMPTTGSVEFHEPPGYGFYQDGAELPWSDLVTPPQNSFLTQTALPSPSGAVSTEPLAWFSQGYEPAWDGEINQTGYLGTGMYNQAQHDEYGDAYDRVWSTASYLSSASYNDLNYELLSPVTVLKRGLSQWGWETQQLTPGTQQWWFSPVSVYAGTAYAAAARQNRDNTVAGLELTFDLAWQTAMKNAMQAIELNAPVVSPWHSFIVDLAGAVWNRLAASKLLGESRMSESEARVEIACRLFAAGTLSFPAATRWAGGLARRDFEQALLDRDLPVVHIDDESLNEDLQTLRKLA